MELLKKCCVCGGEITPAQASFIFGADAYAHCGCKPGLESDWTAHEKPDSPQLGVAQHRATGGLSPAGAARQIASSGADTGRTPAAVCQGFIGGLAELDREIQAKGRDRTIFPVLVGRVER